MNNNDFSDLGRDIGQAVRDAMDDFTRSRTFDEIKKSVDEIRRGVDSAMDKANSSKRSVPPPPGAASAARVRRKARRAGKRTAVHTEFKPRQRQNPASVSLREEARSPCLCSALYSRRSSVCSASPFLLATVLGAGFMLLPAVVFRRADRCVRSGNHQRRRQVQLSQALSSLLRLPGQRQLLYRTAAGRLRGTFPESHAARSAENDRARLVPRRSP